MSDPAASPTSPIRAGYRVRFVHALPWLAACVVVLAQSTFAAGKKAGTPAGPSYTGCCDGSASAPINAALFAAASDEGSTLRLYSRGAGGAPVAYLHVAAFLGTPARTEADLEAAARLGDRIYWIGSHSRKSDGRPQPHRQVLFATQIQDEGALARLQTVGRPFRGLLDALAQAPALARYELATAATRPGEAPGGLNIEGLAAGPADSLWIGFRNPVPLGRALLVPLLNPAGTVQGEPARLGDPAQIDLRGLGIRDMARAGDRYLIVAGPAEGGGHHHLYLWHGDDRAPIELPKTIPRGFGAEGLVVDDLPAAHTVEILGDDNSEKLGGSRCDGLKDATRRAFRALRAGF